MSGNDECYSGNFGDSLQLTNWILDSRATCHMTPRVSYFIPGPLEDMDKHIEVADGHHITAKQKEQVQIKMCDNNRDPFIHRWELLGNYPVFTVVMVIYHYIERIRRIIVTPNILYNIYNHEYV